jgi:hypothetical protein
MKKQTAVECLEMEIVDLELNYEIPNRLYELLEIAKQMEKEQIMDAYINGSCDCEMLPMDSDAEQYYKETYNK